MFKTFDPFKGTDVTNSRQTNGRGSDVRGINMEAEDNPFAVADSKDGILDSMDEAETDEFE